MTTLILIRHGESEANKLGFFAGQMDVELRDNGITQAKLTADYICRNYMVDIVYSSDLRRASDTAQCIADLIGKEVIKTEALREIYAGKWQGTEFSVLQKDYADDYGVWLEDIGNARCTDGESVCQLAKRVINELTRICIENDGKTVAVATHATPIRALQCMIQKGTLDEMKNIPWVSNASVSVFEYDSGEWNIALLSEDKHLDRYKTQFPPNV